MSGLAVPRIVKEALTRAGIDAQDYSGHSLRAGLVTAAAMAGVSERIISAHKFNTRYATLGFSDTANLDDGAMWPSAFALTELTAAEEAKIGALVKQAVR